MTNTKNKLLVLLIVQLLLVVGLYWYSQQKRVNTLPTQLFAINATEVDKITIADKTGEATLQKESDGWHIAKLNNLKIESGTVEKLLDKLLSLRAGWPIASTTASHQRFSVAEDNFERKVSFYKNGKLVDTLLVGTSPGLKKLHIRKADNNDVYADFLNLSELFPRDLDWLNRSLLSIKDVDYIKGADYEVKKSAGTWALVTSASAVLNQPQAPATANQAEIDSLAKTLETLKVRWVEPKPTNNNLKQTVVTVGSGDTQWQLTFIRDGDKNIIARNDIDAYFGLSRGEFDKITLADRESLSSPQEVQE